MLLCLGGCGGSQTHTVRRPIGTASIPVAPTGPAVGLTEDNADLLWSSSAGSPTGGTPFQPARVELTALHPTYIRLLVDWAALQPREDVAPDLEATVDGCARGIGPCGPYAGLRAELAAIASQQRAAPGSFQVVLDIFGAPSWAALPPHGCELASTAAFARPLRASAIGAYRALIGSLLTLGRSEGVPLSWWSPWNEPNDPRFISPQRASCATSPTALSPVVYAELARAMHSELQAHGGKGHEILGELNDLQVDSAHTLSVASFVAALPVDVICLGAVWSIHAYAARHGHGPPLEAAAALERALAARGGCGRSAPIWITEAGAGAAHPGRARLPGSADELAGCEALATQLRGWARDPRVQAVFQYSFREDTAFPVGLISADLGHLYPAYRLLRAYARARARGAPPAAASAGCA
jgi:hypothetical protein